MQRPGGSPSVRQIQAMLDQGLMLEQQGRIAEAEHLYRTVLQQQPRNFYALHALGLLACQTGRLAQGVELIGKAIRMNPGIAEAHVNLAQALTELGQFDRALTSLGKALSLRPDLAGAHVARGVLLERMGRPGEALQSYDRAISRDPALVMAHINRGNVLETLHRPGDAVASHDRAIALDPGSAPAHYNRGVSLQSLGLPVEAVASYARAIALQPDFVMALNNHAHALLGLGQPEAALESLDVALAHDPAHAAAHHNRGVALQRLGRFDDAIAALEQALRLDPDVPLLAGDLVHTQMLSCDWRDLQARTASIVNAVAAGRCSSAPFTLLALVDDPVLHLAAARLYAAVQAPALPSRAPARPADGTTLRIGYFSADFRNHPVTDLVVEVLENHDRRAVTVEGFGFGAASSHPKRARVEAACDRFHDVSALSDRDVAALAQARGIDIAIDLGGYTDGARPGIFAHRAAPVQISWLGYLGTMGAPFIDHVVADEVVVPEASFGHFTERVIHLPVFQANPRQRAVAAEAPSRSEVGLPARGFVFCCFNSSYKIGPEQFALWMNILRRVDGSVLWLLAENAAARRNLLEAAAARGIAPERLVFAGRVPPDVYMARYRLADLFLDTLPYNAGTTASDALWAGVPVLTRMGAAFAGRMAASLLRAVGLEALIAADAACYEEMAVRLALSPVELEGYRAVLAAQREVSALFDPAGCARALEAALLALGARR